MKAIPGNNSGPQWGNDLLNDLVFIKTHLRYRLSKKTIPSGIALAAMLAIICRGLFIIPFLANQKSNSFAVWFIATMLVVIFFTPLLNYWRTLQFSSIPTPLSVTENMKLIEVFLRSQQLALYRHPQAPEVFQIISRPLGTNTEQREVMIFIADDKRVLINSHFINQKWTLSGQSRNSKNMAARLGAWLKTHYMSADTDIMVQ